MVEIYETTIGLYRVMVVDHTREGGSAHIIAQMGTGDTLVDYSDDIEIKGDTVILRFKDEISPSTISLPILPLYAEPKQVKTIVAAGSKSLLVFGSPINVRPFVTSIMLRNLRYAKNRMAKLQNTLSAGLLDTNTVPVEAAYRTAFLLYNRKYGIGLSKVMVEISSGAATIVLPFYSLLKGSFSEVERYHHTILEAIEEAAPVENVRVKGRTYNLKAFNMPVILFTHTIIPIALYHSDNGVFYGVMMSKVPSPVVVYTFKHAERMYGIVFNAYVNTSNVDDANMEYVVENSYKIIGRLAALRSIRMLPRVKATAEIEFNNWLHEIIRTEVDDNNLHNIALPPNTILVPESAGMDNVNYVSADGTLVLRDYRVNIEHAKPPLSVTDMEIIPVTGDIFYEINVMPATTSVTVSATFNVNRLVMVTGRERYGVLRRLVETFVRQNIPKDYQNTRSSVRNVKTSPGKIVVETEALLADGTKQTIEYVIRKDELYDMYEFVAHELTIKPRSLVGTLTIVFKHPKTTIRNITPVAEGMLRAIGVPEKEAERAARVATGSYGLSILSQKYEYGV